MEIRTACVANEPTTSEQRCCHRRGVGGWIDDRPAGGKGKLQTGCQFCSRSIIKTSKPVLKRVPGPTTIIYGCCWHCRPLLYTELRLLSYGSPSPRPPPPHTLDSAHAVERLDVFQSFALLLRFFFSRYSSSTFFPTNFFSFFKTLPQPLHGCCHYSALSSGRKVCALIVNDVVVATAHRPDGFSEIKAPCQVD